MTRTIAIVGGGLSGTLTAVHLMRRAVEADLRIVLINRSGLLARGVAYGTRSADHVLNVPAARMSAFEADEGHFLRLRPDETRRRGTSRRLEPGFEHVRLVAMHAAIRVGVHRVGHATRQGAHPRVGEEHLGFADGKFGTSDAFIGEHLCNSHWSEHERGVAGWRVAMECSTPNLDAALVPWGIRGGCILTKQLQKLAGRESSDC